MLGIDVMKLADFSTVGLPPDADLDTATTSAVACTSCHAVMDPVARLFYSFGNNGEYRPARVRPPPQEMFEASFRGQRFCTDDDDFCSGAIVGAPADSRDHVGDPITWLAARIVQDARFPYAMVLPLFEGLTGARVLRAPVDPIAADYAEQRLAFAIQNAYLTALAQRFDTVHGRNLKALARDILTGPFFRGGPDVELDDLTARALTLAGVGRGVLVTPEQWSAHLRAVTDEVVTATGGDVDLLRAFDEYRILFGGVNWESLTTRFRQPNPVMMRIVERAANQVACRVVAKDAARKTVADRKLLAPTLDVTASDAAAVQAELARLRLRLLGEDGGPGDAEVMALWSVYEGARQDAIAGGGALPPACRVTATDELNALTNDPSGALRAWMVVVAALLSDPLFVVE
ncbi:MAG: hypothetical protein FJ137_04530 [Deltaproteobacteria bacterium]|nr:hypothetical protein [Deltaproteobacteria bacterium]